MADLFPDPGEGDFVLVDTSAYGLPGDHWCRVSWVLPETSASPYRVNVSVPGRGGGQFRPSEVAGWRASGRCPAEERPGPDRLGLAGAEVFLHGLPEPGSTGGGSPGDRPG